MKAVYFSFCHPEINPGGAQAIAKKLHDEHIQRYGAGSSLFIAGSVGGGVKRSAGSNIIQVNKDEFLYITEQFDHVYFVNSDTVGQKDLLEIIASFSPDVLHFHHFMAFGIDFLLGAIRRFPKAKSIFTVHEHLLVCHNDGHLIQNGNNRICTDFHAARCATCLPTYRFDYFHHRLSHFEEVLSHFDVVTAVSQFTANVIGKSIKTKNPIIVIPNGPCHPSNKPQNYVPTETDRLHIAYIGQIHRTKGVHTMLEGVKRFIEYSDTSSSSASNKKQKQLQKNVAVTVWGAIVNEIYKGQINSLLGQLRDLGVRSNLGGVYAASNLKAVLSEANVVIVPSLWPESYCLTADEAIEHGKILICADFPAIRERFRESPSVRFVPPGNADAIARVLQDIHEAGIVNLYPDYINNFFSFDNIFTAYTETV